MSICIDHKLPEEIRVGMNRQTERNEEDYGSYGKECHFEAENRKLKTADSSDYQPLYKVKHGKEVI